MVADCLSKYTHFVGLKHPFTAVILAAVFTREIVRLHGVPHSIVSDRDKIFLTLRYCPTFQYCLSSSSHGWTKVLNRCLETYLCCFVHHKPKSWARYLSWSEYCYNTSFHTVAMTTPFHIVYGRDPPSILTYEAGSSVFIEVDQQLLDRDAILEELQQHLHCAQQQMKTQADSK